MSLFFFFLKIVNHTAWIAQCWCRQNQQTRDFSIPCSKNQSGLSCWSTRHQRLSSRDWENTTLRQPPKGIFSRDPDDVPDKIICTSTCPTSTRCLKLHSCHSIQILSQELLRPKSMNVERKLKRDFRQYKHCKHFILKCSVYEQMKRRRKLKQF